MRRLLEKYKSVLSYLFFGVCTTLVNIFVYYLCSRLGGMPTVPGTAVAWFASVVFAFFTNKWFVFESKSWAADVLLREAASFFACRAATGVMDLVIMYIGVDRMRLFDVGVKIFSNILVIILNYVMSKLLIFRKKRA